MQPLMQQMQVTVPQNCGPGTTLQLQTPAGTTLQVQVPLNMKAGQTFMVQYEAPQVVLAQALPPMVANVPGANGMLVAPQPMVMDRNADCFGEANFIYQRMEMIEACGIEAKNRCTYLCTVRDFSRSFLMRTAPLFIVHVFYFLTSERTYLFFSSFLPGSRLSALYR